MTKSVTIGTPHGRDLTPEYVVSLIGLLRASTRPIAVALYQSSLVHVGRNTIAQGIVNSNSDYLLFIDSDMEFPSWAAERLISRNKDIIGGLYYKKGEPHQPLVYKINGWNHEPIKNPPADVSEVDGIGTGFLLIKREVLAKLFDKELTSKNGFPFNFIQKPDGNDIGEDLAFCKRARDLGYKIWCDPTIPLKHVGESYIDAKTYYESMKKLAIIDSLPYDNEIEGWMTKEELNWLYKVAADKDSIVEVGSWKGRSTAALCESCKGKVTAIDHFKGSDEPAHKGIKPFDDFLQNVGMYENLEVFKMSSKDAAPLIDSADMIFIDASHDYKNVKSDLKRWLPKAKKLICGHDFQWPGVQQAVTEELGFVHTCGTIWYKKLDDTTGDNNN